MRTRNVEGSRGAPVRLSNVVTFYVRRGDVFAWLCTLANINGVDLEKACAKYTGKQVKGFKPK